MLAKHALSQLSYGPIVCPWPAGPRKRGRRPLAFGRADHHLPYGPEGRKAERPPRTFSRKAVRRMSQKMVGLGRLELPTSRLSSARSNQLSYKPELSQAAVLGPAS